MGKHVPLTFDESIDLTGSGGRGKPNIAQPNLMLATFSPFVPSYFVVLYRSIFPCTSPPCMIYQLAVGSLQINGF